MTIPDRIIRMKSVLAVTGLSRSTVYRKVNNGTFPPKFKISTQCSGWYESAVKTWMANPQFYHVNDFPQTPSL